MSQFPNQPSRSRGLEYSGLSVEDRAIAKFFNQVYAWMAAGLALTAVVAWYVSTNQQLLRTVLGPMAIVFMLAELGLVVGITWSINRISATVATILFMLFAGLNGMTLSIVFLQYAHSTLGVTFGVTAGAFAVTSVYGMVTRRDLSQFRSLLFMGLVGIILASFVNVLVGSTALEWIISFVGVALFIGLTAYDTQQLKMMALQTQNDAAMSARVSVYGALRLYLDFINLFLFLLQMFGGNGDSRRR